MCLSHAATAAAAGAGALAVGTCCSTHGFAWRKSVCNCQFVKSARSHSRRHVHRVVRVAFARKSARLLSEFVPVKTHGTQRERDSGDSTDDDRGDDNGSGCGMIYNRLYGLHFHWV